MNIPIYIVVDIVSVAILIFFIFRGRKSGFIKTLSGIVSLFLAFSLAGTFAKWTAPYISETYVAPYINEHVSLNLADEIPATEAEASLDISNAFAGLAIPESLVSDAISDFTENLSKSFQETTKLITNTVAFKLTYAVLFLIYFILLRILLLFVFKLLNLTARLPGLNFINKTLGLILGAVLGYLIVIVFSYALAKLGLFLTEEIVSDTFVFKHLMSVFSLTLF